MTFADKLKYNRKLAGLTQAELAKRLGVSHQMIAAYESGSKNPKWETIMRLADALDVNPEQLYGDEQAPLINVREAREAMDKRDGDLLMKALGLPTNVVQWVGKVATVKEAELILAFRELTEEQQDAVLVVLRGMK